MTTMRTYVRPLSTWWWLKKRSYFLFVMRELSSFFVAWFVVYLLMLIAAIGRGEAAYRDFLDTADSPAVLVLNGLALVFVVLHTVTWFNVTPQAMSVAVRGRVVPQRVIIAAQYAGLAIVSLFVYWLVTR
jgi:fumarate reductase subunit C